MRSLIPMTLAVLLAAALAHPASAANWQAWNAGLQAAKASGRPVLVDVYTDWCRWCKKMDADVYRRADVDAYLREHFVTVRLNAEGGEAATWQGRAYTARTLASTFGVDGYPTTVFLSPTGERLVNVPGYVEPERFLLLLRYIGDGHMARQEPWEQYLQQAKGAR